MKSKRSTTATRATPSPSASSTTGPRSTSISRSTPSEAAAPKKSERAVQLLVVRRVQLRWVCGRRTLKVLRSLQNLLQDLLRNLLQNKSRYALAAAAVVATFIITGAAVSARAQEGAMSPYQDEKDGVSAGGKWM